MGLLANNRKLAKVGTKGYQNPVAGPQNIVSGLLQPLDGGSSHACVCPGEASPVGIEDEQLNPFVTHDSPSVYQACSDILLLEPRVLLEQYLGRIAWRQHP